MSLAVDLCDRAVEAQACYSLGNTYTLLRDYPSAIDYHMRHLRIAQELSDKVGEGKHCGFRIRTQKIHGNLVINICHFFI